MAYAETLGQSGRGYTTILRVLIGRQRTLFVSPCAVKQVFGVKNVRFDIVPGMSRSQRPAQTEKVH